MAPALSGYRLDHIVDEENLLILDRRFETALDEAGGSVLLANVPLPATMPAIKFSDTGLPLPMSAFGGHHLYRAPPPPKLRSQPSSRPHSASSASSKVLSRPSSAQTLLRSMAEPESSADVVALPRRGYASHLNADHAMTVVENKQRDSEILKAAAGRAAEEMAAAAAAANAQCSGHESERRASSRSCALGATAASPSRPTLRTRRCRCSYAGSTHPSSTRRRPPCAQPDGPL